MKLEIDKDTLDSLIESTKPVFEAFAKLILARAAVTEETLKLAKPLVEKITELLDSHLELQKERAKHRGRVVRMSVVRGKKNKK